MKLSALKKRAKEAGVDEEKLEEADDEEDVKGVVIELIVAQLVAAEAADPAAAEAARREEELQKLRAELEDTAVEVLPLQRAMVVQGSHECPDDGTPGTLELVLSNEFSWVTNKLVVLRVTKSTAEQRYKVVRRRTELRAAQLAQEQRETADDEEQRRAEEAAMQLKEARKYIRFEELLKEALECCPETCPDKVEVVKALRGVALKVIPEVCAAKETVSRSMAVTGGGWVRE